MYLRELFFFLVLILETTKKRKPSFVLKNTNLGLLYLKSKVCRTQPIKDHNPLIESEGVKATQSTCLIDL